MHKPGRCRVPTTPPAHPAPCSVGFTSLTLWVRVCFKEVFESQRWECRPKAPVNYLFMKISTASSSPLSWALRLMAFSTEGWKRGQRGGDTGEGRKEGRRGEWGLAGQTPEPKEAGREDWGGLWGGTWSAREVRCWGCPLGFPPPPPPHLLHLPHLLHHTEATRLTTPRNDLSWR